MLTHFRRRRAVLGCACLVIGLVAFTGIGSASPTANAPHAYPHPRAPGTGFDPMALN